MKIHADPTTDGTGIALDVDHPGTIHILDAAFIPCGALVLTPAEAAELRDELTRALRCPMGDKIRFHNENGTTAEIMVEPTSEGQTLFEIKIDGLVTWPELEALCFRLHPPGISARGHATLIRDATPWLRGPNPDDLDSDAHAAALAAEPLFPLVDEEGWSLSDAVYVPCPDCGAIAGDSCDDEDNDLGDEGAHERRMIALAVWRADVTRLGGSNV